MVDIDDDWEEWNPSKGSFISHMIAGSAAGVVEHVAIFPIDTIKTHMQCQRCPINGVQIRQTAIGTAKELVKTDGFGRLFRGVSAMFGACIPAHAVYFSVFEFFKGSFGADGPSHTPLAAGAAGVCATISHDIIMTPMDVVKQRLQLGYYAGTIDCLKTIIKHEGLQALYRSFPTTLFMNLPYSMIMVASNESFRRILNPTGEHNIGAWLISGAAAGAVAGALTNPLDVAKTRLQTQLMLDAPVSSTQCPRAGTSGVVLDIPASCRSLQAQQKHTYTKEEPHLRLQYRGLLDALRQIRLQEGYAGFFNGVIPRLLVHTPSVAVSWTTYEVTKRMLQQMNI